MTNKIVLGVVAVAILAVGLVIATHRSQSFGSVSADATVITGDLSVTGNQAIGGNLTVAGSVPFATSSLANLIVGGTVTSTALVATGTAKVVGIATMATTSVTGFCVYNGTNFTKVSFAANSTTPAYATSTSCL